MIKSNPSRWGLLPLAATALFTANLTRCDCNSVSPECSDAVDCYRLDWYKTACAPDEGHWECHYGACLGICDPECTEPADCEGLDWPAGLDCDPADGRWECGDSACEAFCNAECNAPPDCQEQAWPEECHGHWDCVQGLCEATCETSACGDATCDVASGETADSCPADCLPPCSVPADCIDAQAWELPCAGRWSCEVDQCVQVCDYASCGDGLCSAAQGEDAQSCRVDCFGSCQWPGDCLDETWTQICQGHWNCFANACEPVCESMRCGDGTCSPTQGESPDTCFKDCLGGPCAEITDCVGQRWYESCPGHWVCAQPGGACEAVCEASACGDGICEVLAGETPFGCGADCESYTCDTSPDCDGLPLPEGCVGPWLCVGRACLPLCGP